MNSIVETKKLRRLMSFRKIFALLSVRMDIFVSPVTFFFSYTIFVLRRKISRLRVSAELRIQCGRIDFVRSMVFLRFKDMIT